MRKNSHSRHDAGRPGTVGALKSLAKERNFFFWRCRIDQSQELPGVTIETPNLSPRPSRPKVLGSSHGGQDFSIPSIGRRSAEQSQLEPCLSAAATWDTKVNQEG